MKRCEKGFSMSTEPLRALPPDMIEFFARKGLDGATISHTNGNGVKVRRITQMMCDLTTNPIEQVSVLDLACGEGVYAIEAALRGATVLAIDARTERMGVGAEIVTRLGLANLRFEQGDVRSVRVETHGQHDVVYFLGILYHLDVPDSYHVLEHLHALCREWLFIDTHITLAPTESSTYKGRVYRGRPAREHGDTDSEATRRSKVLMSIDNTFAFQFDKASLVRLLVDTGFTTVVECLAPLEAGKAANRITLAAKKGRPILVSTYPWVNSKSEDEIAQSLPPEPASPVRATPAGAIGLKGLVKRTLRRFGYDIRRVAGQPSDRASG
jgi:SAM-dependent methyltransferase